MAEQKKFLFCQEIARICNWSSSLGHIFAPLKGIRYRDNANICYFGKILAFGVCEAAIFGTLCLDLVSKKVMIAVALLAQVFEQWLGISTATVTPGPKQPDDILGRPFKPQKHAELKNIAETHHCGIHNILCKVEFSTT